MTLETILTLSAGALTAANAYLAVIIVNATLKLKLWTRENFVAKDDMPHYLGPIKESVQILHSAERAG